jgi:protein-tyrosine phosphatase
MRPEVFWIDIPDRVRLAIMARPRSGDWLEEEIFGWSTEGIDVVVSLLEAEEIDELGLWREEALCVSFGIEFISFPLKDRGVPRSTDRVVDLVAAIVSRLHDGKAVAVHCRAGIGRASLIAACVLVARGSSPELAFDLIAEARGVGVPDTPEQRAWVDRFNEARTKR